jgi:hypothetical protein
MAGSPKSVDIRGVSFESAGGRRRRRALAAFMTGAALFAASWIALQSNVAGASPGGRSIFAALSAALDLARASGGNAPPLVEIPIDPTAPTQHEKRKGGPATRLASRRPVCVRLCDGFFFPVSSFSGRGPIASEKANCAALCPDAPAALYFLPAGSDKIEDAVSASGRRYTALPVSLRYRTTLDSACACRRAIGENPPYWQDPTLRKGDAVMTAGGFVVFDGAGHSPYRRGDFTALAAAAMPGDRRATLTAIERASARAPSGADRIRIAAAATRPNGMSHGANEIRFAAPPVSATN